MIISCMILSIAGLIASLYAYFLEQKIKMNANYKAVCDISDLISCTKPILSKYGKLLGFSNALLGIAFYSTMTMFAFLGLVKLIFFGAVAACISSVYFGWILYAKIKSVCLICTTIYSINILLLIFSYLAYK